MTLPLDALPWTTVPRTGRSVIIGHPNIGEFLMRWNPVGVLGTGQWETPDGLTMLCESDDMEPMWWRDTQ